MKKFITLIILVSIICFTNISVNAHSSNLEVEYDNCVPSQYVDSSNIGDGYNEKWYSLSKNNKMKHIANNQYSVTTIRYYFYNESLYGNIKWSEYLSDRQIYEFKQNFINSMEKWNHIFLYYDNGNYYSTMKLVKIIEGTEDNHNIAIRPVNEGDIAQTKQNPFYIQENETLNDENIEHVHCQNWIININIDLLSNYFEDENLKPIILSRTGAHEIGHILGLYDIDQIENTESSLFHHEEVLMGYSYFVENPNTTYQNRQTEITYRDIIGAAIIRGYHSDSNHKWLCDETFQNGKYKLICSICNGIKYVNSINDINYDKYYYCDSNHSLESGNMMPVASYDTKDYYKCKYCRYVAPVTSIVDQNYLYTNFGDSNNHYKVNDIDGFRYKIIEKHDFSYEEEEAYCNDCGYSISMNNIIISDPDEYTNCGSQINIYENNKPSYEKSYRGNTIVQGFTRLLYFATPIAPSLSRLDYIWSSSNTNVATVSIYGTVTALNVTEPTEVLITARHKTSEVILYKKLLIIPDINNDLLIINYEIQMDHNDSYNFVLNENAPTLTLQNYDWVVINQEDNTFEVKMSKWGRITANSTGIAYIKGTCTLNSNIIIQIKVIVS